MGRRSSISEEEWEGSIRRTYETDARPSAVRELAVYWSLTPRRIRQVAKERGWARPGEVPTVQDVRAKVSAHQPKRAKAARRADRPRAVEHAADPHALAIPEEVLATVPSEVVDTALPGRKGKKLTEPKAEKVDPPKGQRFKVPASGNQAVIKRVSPEAPPGVRAAVYAPDLLDSADSYEAYREIIGLQIKRSGALSAILDTLIGLIAASLTIPDDTDDEAMKAKMVALNTLLPGKMDSLSTILNTTRQLAETVRAHETSLMDIHAEAAKRKAERHATGAIGEDDGDDLSFAGLTMEEQMQLLDAALLLDGSRAAPTFPLPPTGFQRQPIDGAVEEVPAEPAAQA